MGVPLFHLAAEVTDVGSASSYAAIVAREYGIPAVVATGKGTIVLKHGYHVTVNGTTGKVYVNR
jgi:phosphoenolpyruvate synthase/pyruvate phosphate dikinase